MIKLIRIKNPLVPSIDNQVEEIWHDGEALVDLLGMSDLSIADARPSSLPLVSLNGRRIEPKDWDQVWPMDGDTIVVSPYLAGGSVLRTLSSLAVAAASIAVGALTAGAGFALMGLTPGITASLLAGAVSVGGNLLVSALFSGPSSKQGTPSYAFDGPHSLAQSGTVIPKGYGTFRSGGNIIASFIDIEGADQYLNCLVCFGFGPARSLTSIQLNGKDISTYQNVQYYTRLGSNNQTPIPNFNRVVNGYPQDTQCLAGTAVVVPGTGTLTQIIQVDVSFPDGLFVLTNDGNYIPLSIVYQVFYSLAGANDWKPVIQPLSTQDVVTYDSLTGLPNAYPTWCAVATDLPPSSGVVYATDNGPHNPGDPWSGTETVTTQSAEGATSTYTKTFYGEWQLTDPTINQVQVNSWTDGYVNFSGCSTQTLYNRTEIYGLAANKYDIEVIKYGSNRTGDGVGFGDNNDPRVGQQIWIHSVNEISLLDLAYPNMILVGVRALATNQLAGSEVNITALVQYGLRSLDNNILPSALQAFEEDNPACVAADMMLDQLYGGGAWPGITPSNIERFIDEWVGWAQLNDQLVDDGNGGSIRRHVFNGVFDNESNLWDQLNAVGMMSRAQLIPIGRDLRRLRRAARRPGPDVHHGQHRRRLVHRDLDGHRQPRQPGRDPVCRLDQVLQAGQPADLHGSRQPELRRDRKKRPRRREGNYDPLPGLAPGALQGTPESISPPHRLFQV